MNHQPSGLPASGLGAQFLNRALQAPDSPALMDSTGVARSYREFAALAIGLAATLERSLGRPAQALRVGVCLPPGEAGALVNVALSLTAHASVNLNPLAGPVSLREQIAQAGLRHVVLSERAWTALGGNAVFAESALFVEQLLAATTDEDQTPSASRARAFERSNGDECIATVLFSSGSTARPKAIQLTHANVSSNARAVAEAFEFGSADRMFGVLPFFHSFGYTVTLWAPLLAGASVVFHDNPLDARAIGALAQQHRPTVLLATPAMYQAWMRRIEREQLASVRAAVVGAQRLQPALANAWRERFGSQLYEGYGCTELSPVVSANLPDHAGRVRARAGSVGRALEGVELQIRDPQTGRVLQAGKEGDLWVRGPNVMLGYLGDESATRSAIVDGWYDTRDVACIDADGFLTLTGRRSRFSKIGGEMVSHGAVECALSDAAVALGEAAPTLCLAVTALADEQRGERLVVLHTPLVVPVESVLARARADGLANLFTPRAGDCFEVPMLPHLATGKLDLVGLKRLAQERYAVALPQQT